MKTTTITRLTLLPTLVLSAALLQACQKSSGVSGTSTSAPANSPATLGKSNASNPSGTVDGGGGNGVNGKAYESYIIDPTSLPAFQQKIKPIFDALQKKAEEKDAADHKAGETISSLRQDPVMLFKTKTWYLAPVKLKPIDNSVLGLSFAKDPSQQLAFQTDREVWINSDLFKTMPVDDQADLILHEFVESYYLMQFKTLAEICKATAVNAETTQNCEATAVYTKAMYTPPAKRALNADDYQNIRRITNYMATNGLTAANDEMGSFMGANGVAFLKNVASDDESERQTNKNPIKFDSDVEIANWLTEARVLNRLPDTCYFAQLEKSEPCTMSMGADSSDLPGLRTLNLNINSQSGNDFAAAPKISIASSITRTLELVGEYDYNNRKNLFSIGFMNNSETANLKIGDTWPTYTIYMSRKNPASHDTPKAEDLQFEAIAITPLVLTKVDSQGTCTFALPTPLSPNQDVMIAVRKDFDPKELATEISHSTLGTWVCGAKP